MENLVYMFLAFLYLLIGVLTVFTTMVYFKINNARTDEEYYQVCFAALLIWPIFWIFGLTLGLMELMEFLSDKTVDVIKKLLKKEEK